MIASPLLSLIAFLTQPSTEHAAQRSSGVYIASVTVHAGKCSYAMMDVVGLTKFELAGELTEYHNGTPDVGLVIWVGNGTPQRCIEVAQRAAKAAGYLDVHVEREDAR